MGRAVSELPFIRKHFYFIVNPTASNSGSLAVWKRIQREMEASGYSYEHFFTEYPRHAVELAAEILSKNHCAFLIAVGGDGTIHEVMNGAAPFSEAVIGFIPAGSGNDFSRGFHIKRNPLKALKDIKNHEISSSSPIDLGYYKAKDRAGFFVNSLGMGIDATITRSVNESRLKKYFNKFKAGKLVYLYFFLLKWLTYKPVEIHITVDETEYQFKDVWLVNVSNQPYFGGGIKISPESKSDDGLFHIIAVHNISRWKLIIMFITVLWGGHLKLKEVTTITGKEVQLTSKQTTLIHVDGDYIGENYATVKMHHHKIKIAAYRE